MVENKSLPRKLAFFFAVFAVILFCLFPFMQMLSISLKHQWDWGNQSLIPRSINLNAYKELLNIGSTLKELPESVRHLLEDNPDLTEAQKSAIIKKFQSSEDVFPFVKYFRNSLLVSTLSSLASVVLAVLGAYSFSRTRYRERALVQRGVLFVYMFGGTLLLIPMYKLAVSLGFMASPGGSMTALGIVYLVQTLPVSLYMLGNYFRTIPYSIEEAALIDGCNRWQTIYRIILPLSISAIATVFIYSFMIAWNEYLDRKSVV